jgi:hypothetical protein
MKNGARDKDKTQYQKRIKFLLTKHNITKLLGATAKLRKATIISVMSVCLSVRPHGTTWLSMDGFS